MSDALSFAGEFLVATGVPSFMPVLATAFIRAMTPPVPAFFSMAGVPASPMRILAVPASSVPAMRAMPVRPMSLWAVAAVIMIAVSILMMPVCRSLIREGLLKRHDKLGQQFFQGLALGGRKGRKQHLRAFLPPLRRFAEGVAALTRQVDDNAPSVLLVPFADYESAAFQFGQKLAEGG